MKLIATLLGLVALGVQAAGPSLYEERITSRSATSGETLLYVETGKQTYKVSISYAGQERTESSPALFRLPNQSAIIKGTISRTLKNGSLREGSFSARVAPYTETTVTLTYKGAAEVADATTKAAGKTGGGRTFIGSIPNYCPWDVRYELFRNGATDPGERIVVPANLVAGGKSLAVGTYRVLLYKLAEAKTATEDPIQDSIDRDSGGTYMPPAVNGFAIENDDWVFDSPNACARMHESKPGFGMASNGYIVSTELHCVREYRFRHLLNSQVRKFRVKPNDKKSNVVRLVPGSYSVVRSEICPFEHIRHGPPLVKNFIVPATVGWKFLGD